MDGFLDIYSRLVIAILSFTAPLITYLLSVFGVAIENTKAKAKEKEKVTAELLLSQMKKLNSGEGVSEFIEVSNAGLLKEKKSNRKKMNLLNPKRQILRIFIPLVLCVLSLMFQKLIKDPRMGIYSHKLSVTLILASLLFFTFSLIVLRQVAWAAIEAKMEVDRASLLPDVEKAD